MPFTKADMYYKDYDWQAKYERDDPRITGEPDSTLLARKEGYEMLYFINALTTQYAKDDPTWNNPGKASYQKLERGIREYVPTSIRSQSGIRDWIHQNWRSFWDKV